MNQDHKLRLHISTPLGVTFDDLVANIQIKVHDGYMGVNRNQLPTIQIIQFNRSTIRMLDGSTNEFFLGPGLMLIDKYYCRIYVEFSIDPLNLDQNKYLISHEKIVKMLITENKTDILDSKTELALRREIVKLKSEK